MTQLSEGCHSEPGVSTVRNLLFAGSGKKQAPPFGRNDKK
jgi:hypothetical protein